ncbi:hypothetical protein [Shewanella sp.]|uniref:hypothetical protein n=1 Tax=Shewanella sp. TaxID=50422 RepID=UPI003F2C269E
MEKMREEFEAWAKSTFNIDCSEMAFGVKGTDKVERYYKDGDEGGALAVSGMLYAWKASRAALCIELPSFENGSIRGYSGDCEEAHMIVDAIAESLLKAGVSYE